MARNTKKPSEKHREIKSRSFLFKINKITALTATAMHTYIPILNV